jgi:hypothetical protein
MYYAVAIVTWIAQKSRQCCCGVLFSIIQQVDAFPRCLHSLDELPVATHRRAP